MAFADDVLALSPIAYWKLDETTGTAFADATGTLADGAYSGTPTLGEPPATDAGNSVTFDGVSDYGATPATTQLSNLSAFSFLFWIKHTHNSYEGILAWYVNSNNYAEARITNDNRFEIRVRVGGLSKVYRNDTAGDYSDFSIVVVTFNSGTCKIYIDGSEAAGTYAVNDAVTTTPTGSGVYYLAASDNLFGRLPGTLDDVAVFNYELNATQIGDISTPAPTPSTLPMSLEGFLSAVTASLPMRLIGLTQSTTASVPMLLEGLDSTHFLASSANVDWQVILDNVDISATIFGEIEIVHEENSSSLCSFNIIPSVGAIDLDDYERKEVKIIFVGKDGVGATLYTSRRFTGITSEAAYNPDSGIIRVQGTTDLQGRFENLPRAAIDTIIGGSWSEHIFDDAAQGWQYAQDRLSTIPSEVHVTQYGSLITVPFAAKGTADIELTDDEIEFESFAFSRANRRDIISRVQINMDFRFARLRHREIGVHLVDTFGFCHYLNNGWRLPQRSMIESASNSSGWTRISDITFYGLPVAGTYCTPPRGWVGGGDDFCLGAYWTAARRWAQSVTEEYTLIVQSPDIEEAVGEQLLSEDYGIEATYDATDYEQLKDFDSQPAGASYDSNLQDWTKDATDSEEDGRTVMEAAQEIALDRARVSILSRARLNKLSFSTYFRPDLTLEKTVRVNCTGMVAKGKVYRVVETLNSDPDNARVGMRVDIALSRHGGSGLGVDDPRTAATEPDVPAETPTPRQYYVQYRIGGLASSPPDDPDWDGYMTNVQESERDPGAEIYTTRFRLNMPEIEQTARNTVSPQAEQSYEIAVPEDELTMSY